MFTVLAIPSGDRMFTLAQHPGVFLQSELDAQGVHACDAATKLGISQSELSEIIFGVRDFDIHLARRVAAELGATVDYWMHIQLAFNLRKRRSKGRFISTTPTGRHEGPQA